jgi:hypothetical protein
MYVKDWQRLLFMLLAMEDLGSEELARSKRASFRGGTPSTALEHKRDAKQGATVHQGIHMI